MTGRGDILPDVLVIGGSMAGLCAAISARRAGASVMLVEASPEHMRGGNLRHARNIRIPLAEPNGLAPGRYGRAEFEREMVEIAGGAGDPDLIRTVAERAGELGDWLSKQGVIFQTGHIPYSRRTSFFLGGGKAAANALYDTARRLGVDVRYDTGISTLDISALPAGAVILCCGAGQAVTGQNLINRGTPFNTGHLMRSLIEQGAATAGLPEAAHFVAVDGRSPAHDGGIVTRLDGFEHGMVVDHSGARFTDETRISGPRRYSVWGQLIARLPVPKATLIVDAETMKSMPVLAFPPVRADTLCDMAERIGADLVSLERSARDCGRVSLPPFFAYPVAPGLTFRCHGLHVDRSARVRMRDGSLRKNLFAAGAVMAAGVLHTGYLSGTALTISAVFGRIAGEEAARHVTG